jgi:hypothetical protein
MSVIFIDHTEPDKNSKMGSCKFRSVNKFKANVSKSCCGSKQEIESYKCEKRNIFPLQSNICDLCGVYESALS